MLFRSFPSRAIIPTDQRTAAPLIKDQLMALLTVFFVGTKGPLVIIGPSKNLKSFPPMFDPVPELCIYYYSRNNYWNTQYLCTKHVPAMHDTFLRKHRKMLYIVDNCSAHHMF